MTLRPYRVLSRALVAGGVWFFCGAASSCDGGLGERAEDFACPAGEVCDPATPDGLDFVGARFGETFFDSGDVKTVAVGGRQDVRIFEDVDGPDRPLELPFSARFSTGAIAVEVQTGNTVTLRGAASGEGRLRIVSAESGDLFDRIALAASAIDTIEIEPSFSVVFDEHYDDTAAKLYAPGAAGFVRLHDLAGTPLVDEGTTIGGAGITQTGWDRFSVGDLAPGAYQLAVTAGAGTSASVPFEVALPDEVVTVFQTFAPTRDTGGLVCFGARSAGRPIHSSWRFAVDFGRVESAGMEGCVNVIAKDRDEVVVRAYTANDQRLEVVLPVEETSEKRTPPMKNPGARSDARHGVLIAGERRAAMRR